MFEIVEKAKKEGRDVISLTIGEPDFKTPDEVIERACRAMQTGFTHYTSNFGLPELREAIGERYGVPPENVMLTTGASEALLNASLALIEEGSRVIVHSPGFISYFTYAKICRARIEQIPTHDTDFVLDPNRLAEIMDRNVSVVFLNYPNNPTGAVMEERNMRAIAEIAADYNAAVISDEIYDTIHYDRKPGSLAGYENVVVINGFSKSLAMTGWRIGFTIAGEEVMDSMLKVHQVNGVCAPAFAQKAVAEVMMDGIFDELVTRMVQEFRRRRNFVYSELKKYYNVVKPEGAFYIFPEVGMPGIEYAKRLIEYGIAVTPGAPFGEWNENHIRISYATDMENLKKAMAKIEEFENSRRST
jgi:aspartate aminotransferase